ncbi:MAG: TIM barrel protein [Vicinamibacterales bacterium]
MERRDFLAAGATLLIPGRLTQRSPEAPPAGAAGVRIDIFSKHLLWLRGADQVAEAAVAMGFSGVNVTVRPGLMGHVEPARVAGDLPPFVRALRARGLQVRSLTAPILDVDSPHADAILRTAAALDIRSYWWGTFRYGAERPVPEQLAALRPRVAALAALNARYGVCAMYHTYNGNAVGASIWDMLSILREFDPSQVGFHYDTGHMATEGAAGSWATNLKVIGPYLRGVSVKDYGWQRGVDGEWQRQAVPLGEGVVKLREFGAILREQRFAGPLELQAEYPLGGAEDGRTTLTIPQDQVFAALARDRETLSRALI